MTNNQTPKILSVDGTPMIKEDLSERDTLFNKDSFGRDIISGSDSDKDPVGFRHDMSGNSNSKNFDQKIFMFPDSYNELRKELVRNFPNLWQVVGYRMAHVPEEFVEYMNQALDIHVVFDTEKVDFICTTYLDKLKTMRSNSFGQGV